MPLKARKNSVRMPKRPARDESPREKGPGTTDTDRDGRGDAVTADKSRAEAERLPKNTGAGANRTGGKTSGE